MADVTETLASGEQAGYNWVVDHDETVGTVGVTVADNGSPEAGQLTLNAQVVRFNADGTTTVIGTIAPIRIDPFDNLGRHVLYTNAALVNMSLVVSKGTPKPYNSLNIWTTFGLTLS